MTPKQRRITALAGCMAVLMLLVGTVPLGAQATGSITGTVTVPLTGRPLSGVRSPPPAPTRSAQRSNATLHKTLPALTKPSPIANIHHYRQADYFG